MERKETIKQICIELRQTSIIDMLGHILSISNNKNKNNEELMNKRIIEIINLINSKNSLEYLFIFYNNYIKKYTEKDFMEFFKEKLLVVLSTIFSNPENYFCKVYDTKGKHSTILRIDTFQQLIDNAFYEFIVVETSVSTDKSIYSDKEQFLLIIANEIRNAFSSILLKYNYFKEMFNKATDWDTYYKENEKYWPSRHYMFEELKL